MSEQDARLEAGMRAVFAGVDTSGDFDARVMQRVGALNPAPVADRREQFERRREILQRRLRRETWSNAATIAGIGAAAGIVVWRHAPAIIQWAQSGGVSEIDPWFFTGLIAALLAGSLWPLLRRLSTPFNV